MWKAFKAMPVLAKILVVVVALVVIHRVATLSGPHPSTQVAGPNTPDSPLAPSPVEERRPTRADTTRRQLARYESQLSQLQAQMNRCQAETNAYFQGAAAAAANGIMTTMPDCNNYFPQQIAQGAVLTTYITRLKTGNMNITVCEANVGLKGCESLEASASAPPSSSDDDGTEAVENATRQGIRGTSLYTDEAGEAHELPTRNYYFRDRSTGQMIGSDQPDAPNNGRDYEKLTPQQ